MRLFRILDYRPGPGQSRIPWPDAGQPPKGSARLWPGSGKTGRSDSAPGSVAGCDRGGGHDEPTVAVGLGHDCAHRGGLG